jgi:hypothetical protein
MTHLSDDKTVAKMGHPSVVVRSDLGRPSKVGFTAVTTEGDEMVVAFSLQSFEDLPAWVSLEYRDFRCRDDPP